MALSTEEEKGMEGLSFSILKKVKSTDLICERHHENLIQLEDKEPFCPSCTRENINQQDKDLMARTLERGAERGTFMRLAKDSIVTDKAIKSATFDTYETFNAETTKAKAQARKIAFDYLDKESSFNTLLTGSPGVGKSHLAMAMLKAVNAHFDPVGSCLYISINELMRLIRDSFNSPDSWYTEANCSKLLCSVDLLVLDDLGSESSFRRDTRESSEFTQQFLFGVLDQRQRTIITTNLNSAELEQIYNPKLISRMYKGIEGHIISFKDTEDKRKVVF